MKNEDGETELKCYFSMGYSLTSEDAAIKLLCHCTEYLLEELIGFNVPCLRQYFRTAANARADTFVLQLH